MEGLLVVTGTVALLGGIIALVQGQLRWDCSANRRQGPLPPGQLPGCAQRRGAMTDKDRAGGRTLLDGVWEMLCGGKSSPKPSER